MTIAELEKEIPWATLLPPIYCRYCGYESVLSISDGQIFLDEHHTEHCIRQCGHAKPYYVGCIIKET